jgi:glycosyltransferase involved in cell wall biosynthesis
MSQTLPRIDDTVAMVGMGRVGSSATSLEPYTNESVESPFASDSTASNSHPSVVEIALPVYNEEHILEASVCRLRAYLDESFPFQSTICIVDNASTDATWEIATRLANTVPGVSAHHLEQKGKGRAVRAAWSSSSAQIVCYMDVDLSTDLGGLLPLVAPLLSGHSDVSIGSRFARGAHVLRGARREAVSHIYRLLLRGALRNQFTDATCGFKAARREIAELLLPLVRDEHWFFDTEFLVLAERNGFRIHEVPVDWVDDADSRVDIAGVAKEDLRGVARLVRNRATGREQVTTPEGTGAHLHSTQAARYASVGLLSTIAYLVLFFLLRGQVGMYVANIIAMGLTSVGSTFAHVRFTFGAKSKVRMRQAVAAGSLGFATGVALTTFILAAEDWLGVFSASSETLAILAGIATSAFVRLILLRSSAYRSHGSNVCAGFEASPASPVPA